MYKRNDAVCGYRSKGEERGMGAVLGQTEDKLTPARIEAAIEWLKDLKTYKGITDVDELETALAVLNVALARQDVNGAYKLDINNIPASDINEVLYELKHWKQVNELGNSSEITYWKKCVTCEALLKYHAERKALEGLHD